MPIHRVLAPALALALVLPTVAQAHYLFVSVKAEDGKRVADLVFEESPRAGDGEYLDPIVARGTMWLRTPGAPRPRVVKMNEIKRDDRRWLRGQVEAEGPLAIESYVQWGVYRYGDTDALLHYYAKCVDEGDGGASWAVEPAAKLDLDIVIASTEQGREVRVTWRGKPLADASIEVRGPKGRREKLITNDQGRVALAVKATGIHTFRTQVLEADKSGEFEGKAYTQVRHTATLTMNLAE